MYNEPNKAEVERRRGIAALAKYFVLAPRTSEDGNGLSLVRKDGVDLLTEDVALAVTEMLDQYPKAKTGVNASGREVSAIDSAIHNTRNAWKDLGKPVNTDTDEGKPFGLASRWFREAVETFDK